MWGLESKGTQIFCGAKVPGKEGIKRGRDWSLLPPTQLALPASLAVHTYTRIHEHSGLRALFAEQGEGEERRRKLKGHLFMFRDVTPLIFHAG